MTLQYFTLVHILISLIGIAAGFGFIAGLLSNSFQASWWRTFLLFTFLTSLTGFFFPFVGFTPAIIVGLLSVFALVVAAWAFYKKKLGGSSRKVLIVTTTLSLYLNVFVLIAQLFQKVPALVAIAPTQSEPSFVITQTLLLLSFIWIGVAINKNFTSFKRT